MYDTSDLRFVLHVSDFHLTEKDGGAGKARNALRAVAQKLREENIKIDYLVHTGDVINSGDLHEDVSKDKGYYDTYLSKDQKFDIVKFSEEATEVEKTEFNDEIKKLTQDRFKLAAKIMREFISDLNISPGNVIICCGNHDAMRLAVIGKGMPVCEQDPDSTCKYTYKCCEDTESKLAAMLPEEADKQKNRETAEVEQESEAVFEPFNAFLEELEVANSKVRNMHLAAEHAITQCILGNLNFLILNTNWRNPKGEKSTYFCIRCDQVQSAIENSLRNNNEKTRIQNIVIAHKPIYEICETARLPYKRYVKTTFMADIQDFIGENGIYLCGDKHTRSVIGAAFHDIPHYICGEPFTVKNQVTGDCEVEYNLLGTASGKLGMERKIHLRSSENGKWECDIRPQDAIVSRLYELSKGHISPKSYSMIGFLKARNKWETLRQWLYESNGCSIAENEKLNVYFKAISKYRVQGTKDHEWERNDNVFAYVHDRIQKGIKNERSKNILNLRGGYGSGKSTYLGLLYIFLLYQYSIGAIKYIPVYFALENDKMLKKVKSSGSYYDAVKECFDEFAEEVQRISYKEHQSVCYIIDRLDEQDCWSRSSEDSVGRCLLDILAKYDNAWYVMSFGQHRLPFFKNTMPVRKYSDRSDVLYFNPIDVRERMPDDPDQRFKSFVRTYLELENYPAKFAKNEKETQRTVTDQHVEAVCKIIRNFRRLTITPGFIRQNYDYITEVNEERNELKNINATVKEIYSYYIDRQYERCLQRLGYGFVDYAPAMAFLFTYQGYTYERFKNLHDENQLGAKHSLKLIFENQDKIYNAFMFIKKHRDSREYLTALHYHRELRYYAENPDVKIEDDSILNEFITRNIAVEIRKMWTDTNKFIIVCEKLLKRKEIKNCTLSMLLYCLAHIPMYEPIRDTLQAKIHNRAKIAFRDAVPQRNENDWEIYGIDNKEKLICFIDLSLMHTMQVYHSLDKTNSIALVKKLIDDKAFAKYNRQHQMLYYRDLAIRGEDKLRLLNPGKDIVYKGFDFHHCFNYLYVKLNGTDPYPLREFDLFTICDLIESRLNPQDVKIHQEGKSKKDDSFFYRKQSYEKAIQVLNQANTILEAYLNNVEVALSESEESNEHNVLAALKAYEEYKEKGVNADTKQIVVGYFESSWARIQKERERIEKELEMYKLKQRVT